MKTLIRILFLLAPVIVWGQPQDLQNMSVLASQYYQNKEFGKAAELYEQLYSSTKSEGYFNIYFDCLLGIPDYEKAEKEIRKGMRGNSSDSYWYVQWGFLKKAQGQGSESLKMYERAISSLSANPTEYPNLANQFINRREFEYAEKVYIKGRATQNPMLYNYELARIYFYMRNYDLMMKEYLEWVKQKESNLEIVKSSLQSVLFMDNDQEISNQLKTYILKRIQAEPGQIVYNRLLIWLFIQDKNFTAAIRQAVALDKRSGEEDANIFQLANVSASNKNYDEAVKAYDYLISKGKSSEYFKQASQQRLQMYYERFVEDDIPDIEKAKELKEQFNQTFIILGLNPETSGLLIEYGHLLTFYLNQPAEAISFLTDGLAMTGINMLQLSAMKAELGDVYVYSGDQWEAVITYSQVIESNKNTLADDVKFKKAKLGYYMGNFQWAKAQLDALRASTSKLIANDAMDLALFISENLESDSTAAPLKIFARADLQLFRNDFQEALAALDSVSKLYPFNSLTDDVNFRKASIYQKQGKFEEAAVLLESIVNDHRWETLADDALFQLAVIYETKLKRKEEAMEMYKKMLTDYPGSVYVVDSRTEYRKMQNFTKTDSQPDSDKIKEDLFFNGQSPNP
ncbi:MAG TPA: tetratricopeptide repeat protein [Prolixibacteraceae bacterium]|nr:tetratricopeptide repeat protein [Prolixibacteraceae bacterium]